MTLHRNGERQSYSERWQEISASFGVDIKLVDVRSARLVELLGDVNGFMWRSSPSATDRMLVNRIAPALQYGMHLPVFPSVQTVWHFEDKVAQAYAFQCARIPTPPTHIFWTAEDAHRFCKSAKFPLVLKLASGYQSTNVRLLHNAAECRHFIEQMFSTGLVSLGYGPASRARGFARRMKSALQYLIGTSLPNTPSDQAELQHGFFYLQEFVPGNAFDYRVTVIGDRAFAFRRFNRKDDFRASGSGDIDWDQDQIPEEVIDLAFQAAHGLECQTVGVDILQSDGEFLMIELNLAYASWAVRACPGYWRGRQGSRGVSGTEWVSSCMDPADAIFEDFINQVTSAM